MGKDPISAAVDSGKQERAKKPSEIQLTALDFRRDGNPISPLQHITDNHFRPECVGSRFTAWEDAGQMWDEVGPIATARVNEMRAGEEKDPPVRVMNIEMGRVIGLDRCIPMDDLDPKTVQIVDRDGLVVMRAVHPGRETSKMTVVTSGADSPDLWASYPSAEETPRGINPDAIDDEQRAALERAIRATVEDITNQESRAALQAAYEGCGLSPEAATFWANRILTISPETAAAQEAAAAEGNPEADSPETE